MKSFADEQIIMMRRKNDVTGHKRLTVFCFVFNFTMKIASVALLMVSTCLAVCSRVSLGNKIECHVSGMCSVTSFKS